MKILKRATALVILLSFARVESAVAAGVDKELLGANETARPSEFVLESYPGQELIPIRVLGGVTKPGLYHVPPGTNFTTLISLSGGLIPDAEPGSIVISNRTEKKTTLVDLEDLLKDVNRPDLTLKAQDVVYVPTYKPAVGRDTVAIVGLAASIVGIVLAGYLIAHSNR